MTLVDQPVRMLPSPLETGETRSRKGQNSGCGKRIDTKKKPLEKHSKMINIYLFTGVQDNSRINAKEIDHES